MFSLPLDTILLFTLTTPLVGWAASKLHVRNLCGIYSAFGLSVAGYGLYRISVDALSIPIIIPLNSEPFQSCLRIDALSIFMSSTFILNGLLTAVYSVKFTEKNDETILYYALLQAMIAGMIGVVFAGDLFTLFIFWELMCISSYVLVSFRKQRWEAVEAGLKYLVMSSTGSAIILFGLSLIYGLTGTLNFIQLSNSMKAASTSWQYICWFLILSGFGIKTAIVPLHTWLPDAYSAAPSPISAILSAVVTETGLYALCRVLFIAFIPLQIEWSMILAALSVITMTFGNISALLQVDLKRLLAYSSIGHIGYMLAGLAVGTQLGLTGTFLHIFNHALMKGVAFLCVGAIIYRIGKRKLDEVAGIGRKMPTTTLAFGISLFALTGMPPLNGFVSELTIFISTVQADMMWLGISIILNSALSAGYVLRVLRSLLESTNEKKFGNLKEAPITMLLPICLMAALIVLFGIWPDPILDFAGKAASALMFKT